MSEAPPAPKVLRPEDWLGAVVPLGLAREGAWRPIGAGALFIDPPVVWLLSVGSLLDAVPADRNLAAFVSEEQGGTVLDLTTGRRGTPIDWIRHASLDLAACLFPINPAWSIKAFPEARCVESEQLFPGLAVQAVCSAYGSELGARPAPLLLGGTLARKEPAGLVTTLPLLPQNAGTPLLVPISAQEGGGVALAGILLRRIALPDPGLALSVAAPITEALGLIRSEAGRAQRRIAVEHSRAGAPSEPS